MARRTFKFEDEDIISNGFTPYTFVSRPTPAHLDHAYRLCAAGADGDDWDDIARVKASTV